MYDQTGKTEMTRAPSPQPAHKIRRGPQPAHISKEVIVGSMGAPGNIEMTHIHKFRSLHTKVRRVLVVIKIQNQRHAINLQTAHRLKGS